MSAPMATEWVTRPAASNIGLMDTPSQNLLPSRRSASLSN